MKSNDYPLNTLSQEVAMPRGKALVALLDSYFRFNYMIYLTMYYSIEKVLSVHYEVCLLVYAP